MCSRGKRNNEANSWDYRPDSRGCNRSRYIRHFSGAAKETNVKLSAPAQSAVFTTTASGVLTLVNSDVVVTLQSPGNDVQWALGTPGDVEAFVGQAPVQNIVGLKSWQALEITSSDGTPEGSDEVAQAVTGETFGLLGSDMWADEGHEMNTVSVELDAKTIDDKVLIATTSQGQSPEVTLQWVRTRDTSNPVVFYVIGILLALIGTFLLLNWYQEQLALRSMTHKPSVKLRSRGHHQPTTELIAFDSDLAAPTTEREIQRVHTAAGLGATVCPARLVVQNSETGH